MDCTNCKHSKIVDDPVTTYGYRACTRFPPSIPSETAPQPGNKSIRLVVRYGPVPKDSCGEYSCQHKYPTPPDRTTGASGVIFTSKCVHCGIPEVP